jgi:hypothetical protein
MIRASGQRVAVARWDELLLTPKPKLADFSRVSPKFDI